MARSVALFIYALSLLGQVVYSRGTPQEPPANAPLYTGIITQLQEAEFDYQGQARSERDLEMCANDGENAAMCSIVHKRYWQPPLVYRLCRCPDRQECPWRWSQRGPSANATNSSANINLDPDELEFLGPLKGLIYTRDRTMSLNNRSQLKFCQSIRRMPQCQPKKAALRIRMQTIPDFPPRTSIRQEQRLHLNEYFSVQATVNCKCPQARYWKYHRTTSRDNGNETVDASDYYSCAPLKRCQPGEFCGHVSADSFATYYQCSCPIGHLCVTSYPRITVNASELFFSGKAYKAFCTRRWV
ncbi:uncharacterized protein LOC124163919 [Ischnura elegans]|uniref:uncharacterized protein LOC124163919 n=1 Tax=Ischnura elegans TaxID=197161 RepID=UPI001ED8A540|nr:uncharacterized protein LOC124163919 [Ischnura elegans]